MGSKAAARRDSVPQPGNANPNQKANQGALAFLALSNNLSRNQAASAGAAGGTLYGAGIAFTPLVSGKLLITWSAGGDGSAATVAVSFQPTVSGGGGTIPAENASAGGDAAHAITAGGTFITTHLPVGVPTSINIAYTAATGTFTPEAFGSITIVELPG